VASKSVFVGNLPRGTTEEELRELFARWDPTEVRMIHDKGIGFVDMSEEKASEAISTMNGVQFKDRALTVNEARPRGERRHEGPRRDRGFGGGGGGGRSGGRGGRRW